MANQIRPSIWERMNEELARDVEMLHAENALKLKQILGLEQKIETQNKVIKYVFGELWNLLTDGDDPDLLEMGNKMQEVGISITDLMIH